MSLTKIFKYLSALAILAPVTALAQGLKEASGKLGTMKGIGLASDVPTLTGSLVQGAFYLLGTAFLILVIYGGFVWIKAAGRDEEVTRAKKIISTAVIGLTILLSSYAITNFILLRAGATGTGAGASTSTGTP